MNLHDALAQFEASRQKQRPPGVTASGLHAPCPRQQVLEVQGVPPTDESPTVTAATVGTMLHAWYEDWWRKHDPGAMVEVRTQHGQADVYRPDREEIRDLKTVNARKFDSWRVHEGPPGEVWDQLAVYAHDNDLPEGGTLVVDALCRETGRAATYTQVYSTAWGQEVVDALEALAATVATADPWDTPVGERSGRGDWFCDRCPWRSECLGEDVPRQVAAMDVSDIEDAAARWLEAKELAATAKALQAEAKNVLRGVNGEYGRFSVSYREQFRAGGEYVRRDSTAQVITVKPL